MSLACRTRAVAEYTDGPVASWQLAASHGVVWGSVPTFGLFVVVNAGVSRSAQVVSGADYRCAGGILSTTPPRLTTPSTGAGLG